MLGAVRGRPSAASPARIPPSSSSLSLSLLFLFPFLFFHFLFYFFLFFSSISLFLFFSPSLLSLLPPFLPRRACLPRAAPCLPSRTRLPPLPLVPRPRHLQRALAPTCTRARAHNTRRAGPRRPHRPPWRRCAPRRASPRTRTACPERRPPLPRPRARAARRPRHLSLSCSPPRRARTRVAAPLSGRSVPLAATPTPAHVRTPHSAALCSPLPLTSRHPCTTSLPVRRSTTRERGRAPLRPAAPPTGRHLLATAALDHPTAFPPL